MVDGSGHEAVDLSGIGDVGGYGEGAAAQVLDLLGGGLDGPQAAASDADVCAGAGEGADHGEAEAGASAGDEYGLAF